MTDRASVNAVSDDLVAKGVCSLPPAELDGRIEMIRTEIQPHVLASVDQTDGVAWEFAASGAMRSKLEKLAALERECCGGNLDFTVSEDPESGRLRLEILGAEAAAFRIDTDAQAAVVAVDRPSTPLKRWAKAGGIGLSTSLILCCVVPIGLAAIAGASVAGPLLALDDPWIIGVAAVVFGAAAWKLDRRRELASAETADRPRAEGSSCGC